MKFPDKIKIHHRDTEDVVVKRNSVIRCFVDTLHVESSKKKSALLAQEVMKKWNMHDEFIQGLKRISNYIDKEGYSMSDIRNIDSHIKQILKQAEQK